METSNELKPERYRSFLIYLARRSLPELGPAAHKVSSSDIVQDVLLRAYEALPQFRGTTREELLAWLRKILENQLYDVARHFGRHKRDAGLEESTCVSMKRLKRPSSRPPATPTWSSFAHWSGSSSSGSRRAAVREILRVSCAGTCHRTAFLTKRSHSGNICWFPLRSNPERR